MIGLENVGNKKLRIFKVDDRAEIKDFSYSTEREDCESQPQGILAKSPALPVVRNYTDWLDYRGALEKSILFYEAQMAGPLPDWHRVPWRGDATLTDGCYIGVDLSGGFYDAGDTMKFNFPASMAIQTLGWGLHQFKAGYEAAGEYENALRVFKWGVDYFIRCHVAPHELFAQVGDGLVDKDYWGRPEEMSMLRPAVKITPKNPGSDLAAGVSSVFSTAALVFHERDPAYAANLLKRARELLEFATTYLAKYSDSIVGASHYYNSFTGYKDEIVFAGACIARASYVVDNAYFLSDVAQAKSLFSTFNPGVSREYSWDNKVEGAHLLMYEILTLAGDAEATTYAAKVERFFKYVTRNPYTPGGLVHITDWGSARHACNAAFIFKVAADLGLSSQTYESFAKSQLDYVLGNGPNGTPLIDGKQASLVIGHGELYPHSPYHTPSNCPPFPEKCGWDNFHSSNPNYWLLYGALVGGPRTLTDVFIQDRTLYVQSDVTLDFNCGFQGLLAAFYYNDFLKELDVTP